MTAEASPVTDTMALLDWRRTVHRLYRDVREASDPAIGHEMWRIGRDLLFATHPASPLLRDDPRRDGLPIAPYDPAFRFEVELRPAAPHRLEVPTGTDGVVAFDRVGAVDLPDLGALDVWWLASYGGGLFVPIRDGLAGASTFGGGRYVLDTVKGADLGGDRTRLIIDLNFAYNPSCAYDPSWACPLAPPGNHVAVDVHAGELV